VVVRVVDATGSWLPDTVLPGNSSGFTTVADLTLVSTTTYPALALETTLTTTSGLSPRLESWGLGYTSGPVPVPNAPFTLTGAKTIGSTGGGSPIFKTIIATTTDASGMRTMALEWDSYKVALPSHDLLDACTPPPYAFSPNTSLTYTLYLSTSVTTNAVLVSVRDNTGALVPGATVTVSSSFAAPATRITSACGTAAFTNLPTAMHTITISKAGYTTTTYSNVWVSGHVLYAASFP
jgi:hypothetical protein